MKNPNDVFFIFQMLFTVAFFLMLLAGAYLARNFEKLFGVDPNIPNENSSGRTYTKVLVFTVWGHAVFLTGLFALLVH